MNSVPNRGGPHRALSSAVRSMYENMGPEQLRAMHNQARVGSSSKNPYVASKSKEQLKYTTVEHQRRFQKKEDNVTDGNFGKPSKKSDVRYGDEGGGGSIAPSKNFKPSTWHG